MSGHSVASSAQAPALASSQSCAVTPGTWDRDGAGKQPSLSFYRVSGHESLFPERLSGLRLQLGTMGGGGGGRGQGGGSAVRGLSLPT